MAKQAIRRHTRLKRKHSEGRSTLSVDKKKAKVLRVGDYATIVLTYRAGKELGKGTFIRIATLMKTGGGGFQNTDPAKDDFFSITSPKGCEIAVLPLRHRYRSITHFEAFDNSDMLIVQLLVKNGFMKRGDKLELVMGDTRGGSKGMRIAKMAGIPLQFFYHIDRQGKFRDRLVNKKAKNYVEILDKKLESFPNWKKIKPQLRFRPCEAALLDVSIPTCASPGKTIQVKIVAYDKYYNVVPGYSANLDLIDENNIITSKKRSVRIRTDKEGCFVFSTKLTRKDTHGMIAVRAPRLGLFRSNPIIIRTKGPAVRNRDIVALDGQKIFWGELHGHSTLSDGACRDENDFFEYGRHTRGLDFAALADHSFGLAVKGHWPRLINAVKKHNKDGKFVAILACEIMFGYEGVSRHSGHRNIYFPGDDALIMMADYQRGSGGSFRGENIPAYKKIWDGNVEKVDSIKTAREKLANAGPFLWTMHHSAGFHRFDRGVLRLFEVCSEWGISDDHPWNNTSNLRVSDLFKAGANPGLTGGSDDHSARAGFIGKLIRTGPIRYPSGLTAVLARKLTRAEIYKNLYRRRCYATTGARIAISIKSSLRKGFATKMTVWGTDAIDRIQVFKRGVMIHQELRCLTCETFEWKDASYRPGDNYYMRIFQIDGQIAWINPMHFA